MIRLITRRREEETEIKTRLIPAIAMIVSVAVSTQYGCVRSGSGDSGLAMASDSAYVDVLPTFVTDTATPTMATETATPFPSQSSTPSATCTPSPEYEYYKCRVNQLNVRREANTQSEIMAVLRYGEEVRVIGSENGFYHVWFGGSRDGYCYEPYLVPADEELYGYVSPMSEIKTDADGNIVYEDDGVTPVVLTAELVDIRLYIQNIAIFQIFGTTFNFTGEVLYERAVPVLQRGTAEKLAQAAQLFAADGYTIKLYDCYRPKSVQFILYDIVQNSAYIANPYKSASNHNRAAAVDISLIGPDGLELDMPTPMHTFGVAAHRSNSDNWTQKQRENVEYMTNIMLRCGFRIINSEWWHFSDTDYESFMVLDINMTSIPMYTATQLGYTIGG